MSEYTYLKEIKVKKFRNMEDIEIEFGKRITVISGKNGTAKSTILGLVAQIFSFDKDYITGDELNYTTLSGKPYSSKFSDHFRLSEQHDKPGEMSIHYKVYDAYLNKDLNELKLEMTNTKDRKHRMVVRNNEKTPISKNTSRNITHPIIYLSLKRLYPIAERTDEVKNITYLENHKEEFIKICNDIIGKNKGVNITSTNGTIINSSVVHDNTYDHQSVSTGEDNVGQIVQALFSFKKLSEEYKNYHGGILLIDELDAGLFPFSQEKIIEVLKRYSKDLNIQIILSTHSPIMIEKIYELSNRNRNLFKNIFLTQAYGKLQIKNDYTWQDIYSDLFIKTKQISENYKLPTVNIYCEDDEAFSFFNRLITSRKIKKIINPIKEVSIGNTIYTKLISYNIPEFTHKSIIVLDGDVKLDKKYNNVLLLPTINPPDRLIFKFLLELPDNDTYWHNKVNFTKEVFYNLNSVKDIINRLGLNDKNIHKFEEIVQKELDNPNSSGLRKLFKNFYKDNQIKYVLNNIKTNPFEQHLKKYPDQKKEFNKSFINALKFVLVSGFGVPKSIVEHYFNSN